MEIQEIKEELKDSLQKMQTVIKSWRRHLPKALSAIRDFHRRAAVMMLPGYCGMN